LQLTGRAAYKRFGDLTGLPLEGNPSLAADPADSIVIALAFFKDRGVNAAIDRGDFREARRLTNGGSIGLENVAALRAKALEALK
jgi:putative chitinase